MPRSARNESKIKLQDFENSAIILPMKVSILKKILISVVLFVTFISMCSFVNYFREFYENDEPNSETITVIGDSYAGYFAGYESFRDYNIDIYARAGQSTEVNYLMMQDGFKADSMVYVISIGVNDHTNNIDLDKFRERIESLIKVCAKNGKRVILHTYMNYIHEFPVEYYKYKESDYDKILRELGNKYINAYYIDMSDYNNEIYLQDDHIHYNKIFYDELYNRMKTALTKF